MQVVVTQPPKKRHDGDRQYDRHEDSGHAIRQPRDRRFASLSISHQRGDTTQSHLVTDSLGSKTKTPRLIHRSAEHLIAWLLANRQRLAGEAAFVDFGDSGRDNAINRNTLTRANQHDIANDDLIDRDFDFTFLRQQIARRSQHMSRRRLQVQQSADRVRCFATSFHLQRSAEPHEHDDQHRRREVRTALPARRGVTAVTEA